MEYVSGNIYVRQMRFAKSGDVVDGHAHNFDHTTYVSTGVLLFEALDDRCRVTKRVEKSAGGHVLITAGVRHRITAKADNSRGECIYAHRTPQGDVVQEYDGWQPAYC